MLCPRSDHGEGDPHKTEEGDGLALIHDRLASAVTEIRATTTSSRNRNKFCVPEEIRRVASDAAKTRDPVRRRHSRKIAQKARRGTAEWVTHTFRELNKEADLWADKGAKWRVEEWVDTTRFAWSEVSGLSGFWDGSCDNGNCGRGIVIMAYSDLHAWFTFHKTCGQGPGNKSLDAEMGGCGMLMDNFRQWIDKCGR